MLASGMIAEASTSPDRSSGLPYLVGAAALAASAVAYEAEGPQVDVEPRAAWPVLWQPPPTPAGAFAVVPYPTDAPVVPR